MTPTELVEAVQKLQERQKELRAEISSTRSWWMVQLHKHRPDLAAQVDTWDRELRELDEALSKL